MKKPNIIVIMADDMGYGDIGCYNPDSKIPTPNMDAIASDGMLFTDAHSASAVCTPSRYGVLTGRYCWRTWLKHGVTGGYDPPLIETDRMTIASMLKESGYHTACIGKWHVGLNFHDEYGNPTTKETNIDFSQPISNGPTDLGFDYAFYNAACGTCAPPYGFIESDKFIDNEFLFYNEGVDPFDQVNGMMGKSWITREADVEITEKACSYISARSENKEQPFFLYLTPNAPHEPCIEKFVPQFARGKSEAGSRGDLVWLFDWTVGRIVSALKAAGIYDDTLIFVTSDNGPLPGDFVRDESGQKVLSDPERKEFRFDTFDHKSSGPWKGNKAHIWEGGHREPLISSWPEVIPAGKTSNDLVCLTDLFSTCADITGFSLTSGNAEDSFTIPSLLACLNGSSPSTPCRESAIHHSSFGVFSIRKGKWKLVVDCADSGGWPTPRGSYPVPGSKGQLYDLASDPAETKNLWDENKELVAELSELLRSAQDNERTRREN